MTLLPVSLRKEEQWDGNSHRCHHHHVCQLTDVCALCSGVPTVIRGELVHAHTKAGPLLVHDVYRLST